MCYPHGQGSSGVSSRARFLRRAVDTVVSLRLANPIILLLITSLFIRIGDGDIAVLGYAPKTKMLVTKEI